MTVVARTWNRLTLPGKVIFTVIPLLAALTVAGVVGIAILGGPILDLILANLPIARFVVAATVILLITVKNSSPLRYRALSKSWDRPSPNVPLEMSIRAPHGPSMKVWLRVRK